MGCVSSVQKGEGVRGARQGDTHGDHPTEDEMMNRDNMNRDNYDGSGDDHDYHLCVRG